MKNAEKFEQEEQNKQKRKKRYRPPVMKQELKAFPVNRLSCLFLCPIFSFIHSFIPKLIISEYKCQALSSILQNRVPSQRHLTANGKHRERMVSRDAFMVLRKSSKASWRTGHQTSAMKDEMGEEGHWKNFPDREV